MRAALGLAGWIALSFGAALFGSRFPPGEWYASLEKPPWTPPGWLFGPVWTILYALMGAAAWRVWMRGGFGGRRAALSVFLLQLLLNALWSWLFFGLHRPGLALLDILALWAAIAATALLFRRHDATAAAMLLPYLLWTGFAALLNFELWRLNLGE